MAVYYCLILHQSEETGKTDYMCRCVCMKEGGTETGSRGETKGSSFIPCYETYPRCMCMREMLRVPSGQSLLLLRGVCQIKRNALLSDDCRSEIVEPPVFGSSALILLDTNHLFSPFVFPNLHTPISSPHLILL